MFHVDIPKVRGKMAEKGYTISSLSKELGVNRNTLAGYFDNPDRFPYSVVLKMAKILCDGPDEAKNIFFANNLRQT